MKKKVTDIAIKAGRAIIGIISTQLIKYLSSEEFANQAKRFIENFVSSLVNLVIEEKETN